MKKAIFVRSLFALALIACCPLQTRANTIALGFSGGTSLTFGADVTVGLAFTLSSPVLVTDLGLWDFNNDGLSTSHVVTVWTSTGTQEAQVTIPSGSAQRSLMASATFLSSPCLCLRVVIQSAASIPPPVILSPFKAL